MITAKNGYTRPKLLPPLVAIKGNMLSVLRIAEESYQLNVVNFVIPKAASAASDKAQLY